MAEFCYTEMSIYELSHHLGIYSREHSMQSPSQTQPTIHLKVSHGGEPSITSHSSLKLDKA